MSAGGPGRPDLQIGIDDDGKGNIMTRHLTRLGPLAVVCGLLSGGCINWEDRTKWPGERTFQDQVVQLHHEHLTGDYDTEVVREGQTPAKYCNYYAYLKNHKRIRHGRAAWWYDDKRLKAECIYVHGRKTDRSMYFPNGVLAERVEVDHDGETARFYDKSGKLFGRQEYDNLTRKRTYILRGQIVSENDFQFEYAKVVLGVTRIRP